MAAFFPQYLRYCAAYNSPGTLANKDSYVKRLTAYFGRKPLTAITRKSITHYIQTRSIISSNVTINRELSCLRHVFNYAITIGQVETNPVGGVRFLPERKTPLKIPSQREVDAYLAHCNKHDPLLYDISVIAINTGLRRGDVLKIQGDDIDIERRQLLVSVSKTRAELYIPLNAPAFAVLKRRKLYAAALVTFLNSIEKKTTLATDAGGYIFPGRHVLDGGGRAANLADFGKRYKTACSKAAFRWAFRFFRHFFASEILNAGANVRTAQVLLGHSRVTTTERYLAVKNRQTREAVNALPWASDPPPARRRRRPPAKRNASRNYPRPDRPRANKSA
ncbi:MAG: tyrosine-type recombinase/integrase [Hyphomicrobium sp.]